MIAFRSRPLSLTLTGCSQDMKPLRGAVVPFKEQLRLKVM